MLGREIGRFRIVGKLGEGGMGSVWKAEDSLLGRVVALKFLPATVVGNEEARRRFLREARSTSSLDHPGIATLFDAGEFEGQFYLAVAFVDGATVGDLVERGPLPQAEALRIAVAAAEALEHAHQRRIVHRDVTARNIMVARDGRVQVIDFGLARRHDTRGTTSSGLFGTPAYVAPEVLRGRSADPRSDLYSLGVVLYQMLTGTLPFSGGDAAALLYAAAHQKPEPSSERNPSVDPGLDPIVLKALAKDPERRQASAAEFAAELRGFEQGTAPHKRRKAAPRPPGPAGVLPAVRTTPRPRTARAGLAVLPFRDLGALQAEDPQGEALAHGLAEMLGASLARVPTLNVVAPSPDMHAPGFDRDLVSAGRRLGVGLVLSGTLLRSGGQIRVTWSLLDVRRGAQLGGDKVDGLASELLALQDSLFAGVVRALKVETAGRARLAPGLADPAAHEHYLKALGHLQRIDNEASVDAAIRILEELLRTEGDTVLVHAALAKGCLRKLDLTHDPTWKSRAEASCRMALQLDPHSPEVLAMLGRLQFRSGRLDDAVSLLRRSLELREQNPDAWMILSRTYDAQGKFEEAERAARRMIELAPRSAMGYDELGLVYAHQGRFGEAQVQWQKAIELAPDMAEAHAKLGSCHFQLDRLEDARASFQRSIELLPSAGALTGLGTVQFFLGETGEAMELFERAVHLLPRDPRKWANLGDAQRWAPGHADASARSFDRAISLMREQLQANPADAEGWAMLGKWLAKRGERTLALQAIDRAMELAPDNVRVVAWAIPVFELGADRGRALAQLARAVELGYGLTDLERDPELERLRQDPAARSILKDGREKRAGNRSNEPREEDEAWRSRNAL